MDSRWIKEGNTRQDVLNYRNAFEALTEMIELHFVKKEAVRDYSPGWEYKQIAVNEYNAVVSDILKLINLTGDK